MENHTLSAGQKAALVQEIGYKHDGDAMMHVQGGKQSAPTYAAGLVLKKQKTDDGDEELLLGEAHPPQPPQPPAQPAQTTEPDFWMRMNIMITADARLPTAPPCGASRPCC